MFKISDRVIYDSRHNAAVVGCDWVNDEYTIEFDDNQLIPPKMLVPGKHLVLKGSGTVLASPSEFDLLEEFERLIAEGNAETTCPKCKETYTIKPIFTSMWTGCGKCGRSKEEILKG